MVSVVDSGRVMFAVRVRDRDRDRGRVAVAMRRLMATGCKWRCKSGACGDACVGRPSPVVHNAGLW